MDLPANCLPALVSAPINVITGLPRTSVSPPDIRPERRSTLPIDLAKPASRCLQVLRPENGVEIVENKSALAGSRDATYNNTFNTFVSKKLPGIRLVPVELEVGGKVSAKSAKAL